MKLTVTNLSSEEIEVFVEWIKNFTLSPNTDLSRQCEAASTPFLMSTLYKCGQITWHTSLHFNYMSSTIFARVICPHLYIGVPKMFLYQRMRCGESPGEGGVRSQGTLIGNPTTPVTLPGTVTRDLALVTNNTDNIRMNKFVNTYLSSGTWKI